MTDERRYPEPGELSAESVLTAIQDIERERREKAMEEVVAWARKIYFSSGTMLVDDDQRRRFEALGHALARLDAGS